jgi:hypothetical protein
MRQALNNNPTVQIAVVGVLVVVVGLFLMMNLKKGSSSSSSTQSSATPATGSAAPGSAAPGTTTPVTTSPGGAAPSATASAPSASQITLPPPSGSVSPDALIPGAGLPKDVAAAYKRGEPIVVLIVRGGAIDDKLVRGSVHALGGSGVAVFVARAKNVARYSRITQGVGVDRAPALVVVRPRNRSGAMPQAQVRYGFRSSASVVQAVHDALYSGPDDLPYYPR